MSHLKTYDVVAYRCWRCQRPFVNNGEIREKRDRICPSCIWEMAEEAAARAVHPSGRTR